MGKIMDKLVDREMEVRQKFERSITMIDRADLGDWLLVAQAILELDKRLSTLEPKE